MVNWLSIQKTLATLVTFETDQQQKTEQYHVAEHYSYDSKCASIITLYTRGII